MRALAVAVGCIVSGVLVVAGQAPAPRSAARTAELTQDELFKASKIWTVHVRLTADAFQAMQPIQTGRATTAFRFQGPEGMRNGWAPARGIQMDYVHGAFTLGDHTFADVAVRYKGNGTFGNGQRKKLPLKVDLNKYVKGQKLAGVTKLNFHNEVTDASWMNETLSYQLFRDAGVPSPRTSYARVHLTVPGKHDNEYFGLYGLVEDIDTNFVQARFGTREGAILKPATDDLFTDLGDALPAYVQTYDPKTDLSDAEKQRVIEFCKLVSHATQADFSAKVGSYIDLDNFARYLAVVSWQGNPDTILQNGQNVYVYLNPKTRKMSFIPWDQDHAFGTFMDGVNGTPPQVQDMMKPWTTSDRFLSKMFGVDEFRRQYFARLTEFSKTLFRPERFAPQLDALAPILRPSIVDEKTDVLVRFDSAVAGQPFLRPNGTHVVPLKAFAGPRTAELVRQLGARTTN
jgi:spore coat protein H